MSRMIRIPAGFGGRCLLLLVTALALAGCSSNRAYNSAFSSKTALAGNSHVYSASSAAVFNAVKIALIQQGFQINELDAADGLLKGMRTFDDPKDPKIAYLVTLTADVTASSPGMTLLTAAASQKTVLNREVHKYYHLLGLLPIPTGREYQSVVRAEGNITGKVFYRDFFAVVSKNLAVFRKGGEAVDSSARPAAPVSHAAVTPVAHTVPPSSTPPGH